MRHIFFLAGIGIAIFYVARALFRRYVRLIKKHAAQNNPKKECKNLVQDPKTGEYRVD